MAREILDTKIDIWIVSLYEVDEEVELNVLAFGFHLDSARVEGDSNERS